MKRAIPQFGPGPAGAPSTFTPSVPMERPWRPIWGGVGGSAVAAAGVGEAYVIREDNAVRLVVRCLESEAPQLRAWVRWARNTMAPFPFRFYASDPASQHTMVLVSPSWADGNVEPEPSTQSRGRYELEVVLRTADGGEIDEEWRLVQP